MSQAGDNINIFKSCVEDLKTVVNVSQTICQNKLRKEDYLKIQAHTDCSKRTIDKFFRIFLETCPTGRLHKRKIVAMLSKIFSDRSAGYITDIIFGFLDVRDSKDDLDFTDFVIGWSHYWQEVEEEDKIRLIFDIFDTDKKGSISFRDILGVVGTLHHLEGLEQNASLERTNLLFSAFEDDPLENISWQRFQKVFKGNKYWMSTLWQL